MSSNGPSSSAGGLDPDRPLRLGRLKRRSEYLAVAASGRKQVTPGLILQAAVRGAGGSPEVDARFGITASRKVGKAVERNRTRRRLRAVAQSVLPLEGRAGYDYVLIGRAATRSRPFGDLIEDLKRALRDVARAPRHPKGTSAHEPAKTKPMRTKR